MGGLRVPGKTPPRGDSFQADWNIVEPRYFATLRMPFVAGRDFTGADVKTSEAVAIVGEGVVRRFWPGTAAADAVGRYLRQRSFDLQANAWATRTLRIVGVAATSAEALRRAEELRPEVILVDITLSGESGFELARRLAAYHRDGGPAVILISTYSAADFAGPIAESPAAGFLPKRELSADAIRRIVDGRGLGGPSGDPAR
jgi:CheY-like chemotaxis protein